MSVEDHDPKAATHTALSSCPTSSFCLPPPLSHAFPISPLPGWVRADLASRPRLGLQQRWRKRQRLPPAELSGRENQVSHRRPRRAWTGTTSNTCQSRFVFLHPLLLGYFLTSLVHAKGIIDTAATTSGVLCGAILRTVFSWPVTSLWYS